jgi:serine/threonine-protein kinase
MPPQAQQRKGRRRPLVIAGAVVGVVLLVGAGIFGVTQLSGSDAATPAPTTTSATTTSPSAATTSAKSPASAPPTTTRFFTIADYIKENRIAETIVHRGDPGAPVITVPMPPGWFDATTRLQPPPYFAIVHETPGNPDPPTVRTLVSKLQGDVDIQRLLDYAPNELKNLPGAEVQQNTLGKVDGLDAVQVRGTYLNEGQRRVVAQTTVVIPSPSGLYIFQANGNTAEPFANTLDDVMAAINNETKIAR